MKNDITPEGSVCPIFLDPTSVEQVAADKAEAKAHAAAEAEQAAAKAALLTKLGITADEAALLLS